MWCFLLSHIIFCLNWQKSGWGWRDLASFSSSLGWCFSLTKPFSPSETLVDQLSRRNISPLRCDSNHTCSSPCADPVCHGSVLCHRPGANLQILLPEAQIQSHQLLSGRGACGSDRLADRRSRSRDLWLLSLVQVILNMLTFDLALWRITYRFVIHSYCDTSFTFSSTEGSSPWRWASSDGSLCWGLCSAYLGSVQ